MKKQWFGGPCLMAVAMLMANQAVKACSSQSCARVSVYPLQGVTVSSPVSEGLTQSLAISWGSVSDVRLVYPKDNTLSLELRPPGDSAQIARPGVLQIGDDGSIVYDAKSIRTTEWFHLELKISGHEGASFYSRVSGRAATSHADIGFSFNGNDGRALLDVESGDYAAFLGDIDASSFLPAAIADLQRQLQNRHSDLPCPLTVGMCCFSLFASPLFDPMVLDRTESKQNVISVTCPSGCTVTVSCPPNSFTVKVTGTSTFTVGAGCTVSIST